MLAAPTKRRIHRAPMLFADTRVDVSLRIEMDRIPGKPQLRKKVLDRRALPRTSVLWNGFIARSDGDGTFDCIIRNISEAGAEISSKKTLKLGEPVYLLVTRRQTIFLASVAWANIERVGLAFVRSWDVERGLHEDLRFLRHGLVQAKLSQMLSLVQQGLPLAEAGKTVGWGKNDMEQLDDAPSSDAHAALRGQANRRSRGSDH